MKRFTVLLMFFCFALLIVAGVLILKQYQISESRNQATVMEKQLGKISSKLATVEGQLQETTADLKRQEDQILELQKALREQVAATPSLPTLTEELPPPAVAEGSSSRAGNANEGPVNVTLPVPLSSPVSEARGSIRTGEISLSFESDIGDLSGLNIHVDVSGKDLQPLSLAGDSSKRTLHIKLSPGQIKQGDSVNVNIETRALLHDGQVIGKSIPVVLN